MDGHLLDHTYDEDALYGLSDTEFENDTTGFAVIEIHAENLVNSMDIIVCFQPIHFLFSSFKSYAVRHFLFRSTSRLIVQ